MDGAQIVSLSRQIALQRQMDIVANNLANMSTTGFKAEEIMFEPATKAGARDTSFRYADQPLNFTYGWDTRHDMEGGALSDTGNPLDVALNGDGFLTVQTADGERYTRDGAMALDTTGTLVDMSGNPILTERGPIQFQPSETDITISPDGTISTAAGAKGKLKLVEFGDPQALTLEGNNLFAGGSPAPAKATRVVQGAIEKSNVSGITEMTEMIRVSRAYETLANLMEQQDNTRRSAIQRLGDLSA